MSNMNQFAKVVMLDLLRAYKWAVSPIFPPACRYVPTPLLRNTRWEAVERYGAVRGGADGRAAPSTLSPFLPLGVMTRS